MSRKIRILHILPTLEIGGLENGLVNLVNHLDSSRFESIVCCLEREGPMKERLDLDKVKVLNMNIKDGVQYLLPLRLAKTIKKYNIDIVHTRNFDAGLYGVIGAKLAGVPFTIHSEHGLFLQDTGRRKKLGGWFARRVDQIVVVSRELGIELSKYWKIPESKILFITNGVDLERFNLSINNGIIRKEFGLNQEHIVIGTVGRLHKVKNQKLLINAFSNLVSEYPLLRLILVGDGELKQELVSYTSERGIADKVIFAGKRKDVPELMNSMDIFCLPSLTEGMSNTIMEAMASGLPVVATGVGSALELVEEGKTGILVPPQDLDNLTDGLRSLIVSKEEIKRMGYAGRESIQSSYSLTAMVEKYELLYQSMMEKKTKLPIEHTATSISSNRSTS